MKTQDYASFDRMVRRLPLAVLIALALLAGFTGTSGPDDAKDDARLKAAVQPIEDYKTPASKPNCQGSSASEQQSLLFADQQKAALPLRAEAHAGREVLGQAADGGEEDGQHRRGAQYCDDDLAVW